jgi:predicted transcriptional regulator
MKKLYKSKNDKVLSGLIGGLGEYFDVDPVLIRLDLKQSAIYYNLNELKKDGYVKKDGNLELTDLGKVMIMD